ncbi:MAG TPA: hypothetical protein VF131_05520 [Blastocatellia bacterium]|nr:hypothetical protein [Blastocatellia bacterium]
MVNPIKIIRSLAINLIATSSLAIAVLAFPASQTMTGGSVAVEFRGEWVPAKAACTSTLRLIIEPTTVTFVKGSDRAEYRKLDQCFTCMGRDVENITLLSTDAMGDSPFTIYLDGSKKKAAVSVDFSNDKELGKRFPFGAGALKKCK